MGSNRVITLLEIDSNQSKKKDAENMIDPAKQPSGLAARNRLKSENNTLYFFFL